MIYSKKHLFHLVKESPWPFFLGLAFLFLTSGFVFYFNRIFLSFFIIVLSFFMMLYVASQWVYDVENEATLYGYHTWIVKSGLYSGFILFVVSEIMLFFGFFWAFFHSALSPSLVYAHMWPYENAFMAMDCLGFPLYNTILLIISGMTVTYAHNAVACGKHSEVLDGLYMTIFLGILFIISQMNEYFEMAYNMNDSVYASVFFMLTGLHGLHVFVGVFFLYVCLESFCNQDFTVRHYVGFVCAMWYWHFVDGVWMFLYMTVYIWGNWCIDMLSAKVYLSYFSDNLFLSYGPGS